MRAVAEPLPQGVCESEAHAGRAHRALQLRADHEAAAHVLGRIHARHDARQDLCAGRERGTKRRDEQREGLAQLGLWPEACGR